MITDTVAKFIVEADYNQIPEVGVSTAKKAILDCIGATIAGSVTPEVNIIEEYLKEIGGVPEVTAIGRNLRTSAPQAALINGVAGHVLDYDDCAEHGPIASWLGHPSVALLPAILALGEKYNISGRRLIESYIVGFEVGGKIGLGVGKHYDIGWHTTSTLGTMGATAATAKLLRLNVHQTRMALGIAASLASGLRQNFGTMTKSFHAGMAGYNGVVAACLAQKGYTADPNILEAPSGFAKLMSGGGEFDVEKMSENLGNPFAIVVQGLDLKPYPCCRFTHRCIDVTLYLKKKYQIKADEVSQIICKTSSIIPEYLIYPRPKESLEAKFSIQYCTSVALLDGEVGFEQFTLERVNQPDVQALLTKVEYSHPYKTTNISDAMAEPEEVVIKLKNGEEYAYAIPIAKGDFRNPMSEEEVTAKFNQCASLVFTPERQEGILKLLWMAFRVSGCSF